MFFSYWQVLIVLAVLPGFFLVYKVNKMDTIEKEPTGLLVKLFIGGVLSTIFAYIMESIGSVILDLLFSPYSVLYNVLMYFVVVAAVEEFGKYFVLKKLTWNHPAFNYRYDAIVYAVCVSMGFAIFENIEYALAYGWLNTLVRAVTAIPAHCIFAIYMGHYFGQAKYYESIDQPAACDFQRKLAFFVPVLLHGFYDYIATSADSYSTLIFFVFIIVLDIVAYKRIKRASAEDICLEEDNYSEWDQE